MINIYHSYFKRDIFLYPFFIFIYSVKLIYGVKIKLKDFLLLEVSSLTKFGVPKEVMQPIQRDFAIPENAEWDRLPLKRDVVDLMRKKQKNLILQIAMDSIKIFVSYPFRGENSYIIDRYLLDDEAGWSGKYIKDKREAVSLTQLLSEVEAKSLLYYLLDDFSIARQNIRQLKKKNIGFTEFTNNFKKEFLHNFNNILKRIVGNKYDDAKDEINAKAKRIEIENNMIISGLDSTIEGPNSLSILDEFIIQFEDAYSDFFSEHLNIQELSEHFTREKVLTMFMLFIYNGRLMP